MVLVPEAMRLFSTEYPEVTISLQVADSLSVCQSVASGYADIGVASDVFNSPGISYKVAHQATGVCIVPARHRLAKGSRPLAPADLAGESFLSLSPQDVMRKRIDAVFAAAGDKRRFSYESHFAAAICQMVALGMGVSIANSFVAHDHRHLDIVARRFTPEIVFPLYVVYQAASPMSVLAKGFAECFTQRASMRK
jgi:DNA-binding transcriptional LysR family regulator